jgi:hypothetical protein
MEQIKVVIADKVASVVGTPTIICGNSDYEIDFTFDEEWNTEKNKVARFTFRINNEKKFIDVPIEEQKCRVPVLVDIALVKVGVYAGDLRTTTGARIRCKKSILCGNAEETEEGMKNLYEKLQGQIKEIDEKTIQYVDSVNLSTAQSGIYFTKSLTYPPILNCGVIWMSDVMSMLVVAYDKRYQKRYFIWYQGKQIYEGYVDNVKTVLFPDEVSSDNDRQFISAKAIYNYALAKNNVITNGVAIDETYSDEQVYNANSINTGFTEFVTILDGLNDRLSAIEDDYKEALTLIGGAE